MSMDHGAAPALSANSVPVEDVRGQPRLRSASGVTEGEEVNGTAKFASVGTVCHQLCGTAVCLRERSRDG